MSKRPRIKAKVVRNQKSELARAKREGRRQGIEGQEYKNPYKSWRNIGCFWAFSAAYRQGYRTYLRKLGGLE